MRKLLLALVLVVLGFIVWCLVAKDGDPRGMVADLCSIPSVICGVKIPSRAEPSSNLVCVKSWLEEQDHVAVTGSVFKTRRCNYNMKNRLVNGVQLRRVFDCGESVEEQKKAYAEAMRGIDSLVDGLKVLSDETSSSEWGESRRISCGGDLRIYVYLHKGKYEQFPVMALGVCIPYEQGE